MYTKTTSVFFGKTTTFYKNGRVVARRREGEPIHLCHPYMAKVELTRAQAYRYWERYFPGRVCWDLPMAIQVGLEMPCRSEGTYTDINGELVGYAG